MRGGARRQVRPRRPFPVCVYVCVCGGGSCGSCGVAWRPEVHVDKSHFVQRTTSGLDVAVCGCPEHGERSGAETGTEL